MNTIRLRFIPQAWETENKAIVSPGGDRCLIWSVPVNVIDFDFHEEHERRNALRNEGCTPQWIRDWDGPFQIELEDYDNWDEFLKAQERRSFKNTKILTLTQAKTELVEFWRDVLVNDPQNTLEVVRCGKLDSFIPNITKLNDEQVAEKYAELCLGEKYCADSAENPADLVLIQVDDYQFRFAAHVQQLHDGKAIA